MNKFLLLSTALALCGTTPAAYASLKTMPVKSLTSISGMKAIGQPSPIKVNPLTQEPTDGAPSHIEAPNADVLNAPLNTQESFDTFTIIDGPGTQHWIYSSFAGGAAINQDPVYDLDDWLISPAFDMVAGEKYVISFKVPDTGSYFDPARLEVKLGAEPTAEAMDETLFEPFDIIIRDQTNPICGDVFIPKRTGTYHVGIHALTHPDGCYFGVNALMVSSPGAQIIPEEVGYNEEILMDVDLTSFTDGSVEQPVNITNSDGTLNGLPGWTGYEVYSAGGGVLVKASLEGSSNYAYMVPAFTDAKDYKLLRYEVNYTTPKYSSIITGMDMMSSYLLYGNTELVPQAYQTPGEHYTDDMDLDKEHTTNWLIDIPDGDFAMYSADGSGTYFGDYPVNAISVNLQSYWNSYMLVKGVKVTGLTPVLADPANLAVNSYSTTRAEVSWDAIDGAESYVVRCYSNAQYFGNGQYGVGAYDQYIVSEPGISIDVDTSEAAAIVEVFALGKDTRSRSAQVVIFDIPTPTFDQPEIINNQIRTTWSVDPVNYATHFEALAGTLVMKDTPDFVAAHISTENMADASSADGDLYLSDDEKTWIGYGASMELKEGILTATPNWWSSGVILSDAAYDFSEATSNVKVSFTAKAEGNVTGSVYFVDRDDAIQGLGIFQQQRADISSDWDTYTLEFTPTDCARIEMHLDGNGTVMLKDITITCDMPANAMFYKPYYSVNYNTAGMHGVQTDIDLPAEYDAIKIWGAALRAEYYSWDPTAVGRVLWSQYSEPVFISEGSAINQIGTGNATSAQPVYYNLQGIRVDNPTSGIYIKVTGDKKEKVVVE